MIILGIDPGAARTGYAVVEAVGDTVLVRETGTLATSAKTPFYLRLKSIYQRLSNVVAKHVPDEIAVEDVFVKRNVRVALKLGHVRGVVLLVAAVHDVPVGEYSPGEIKQAVVGTGNASKEQVKFMVTALFRLTETPPEDEADALAVALCHVHRQKLNEDTPLDILHKRYSC
jgi:crossover junction endodeoxyribonuclease RuvC